MVAPGTEIPTGNDGVEIDIAALGPQEFPQAATAIAAVAYDIDRFSVIDRLFMGFDEWKPEEIGREFPVGGTLEMAGLLRHRQVATQIISIDTPRLEAKASPKDRTQIGVAAPRIGGEPDGVIRPHDSAFHHRCAISLS